MAKCQHCNCEPRSDLTISEVAAALHVSDRTVRYWIAAGLVEATQFNPPRGRYQIDHKEVDRFKRASRTVEGNGATSPFASCADAR